MDSLNDILDSIPKESTIFHPIHERSEQAWFPGNEAASLAIQCTHIWDDISCLIELRKQTSDKYSKQLLLKYIIIETRSIIEVFDKLRFCVIKAPILDASHPQTERGLTLDESLRAKELFKEYSQAKKQTEKLIIAIRNNIGAHRANINWQQVMDFSDNVSIETVLPILTALPSAFEHIKDLDIYEWNRRYGDGVIEILGSKIRPEDFKNINR